MKQSLQTQMPAESVDEYTVSTGRRHFWHRLKVGSSVSMLLILCACETIPPPPQRVSIPIAVSCLPSTMPVRPQTASEAELALLDDYKFTLAIYLDRRTLLDYVGELEAVLLACK